MVRALYERNIVPDLLVGTSAGAVNAAFLASRPLRSGHRRAFHRADRSLRFPGVSVDARHHRDGQRGRESVEQVCADGEAATGVRHENYVIRSGRQEFSDQRDGVCGVPGGVRRHAQVGYDQILRPEHVSGPGGEVGRQPVRAFSTVGAEDPGERLRGAGGWVGRSIRCRFRTSSARSRPAARPPALGHPCRRAPRWSISPCNRRAPDAAPPRAGCPRARRC